MPATATFAARRERGWPPVLPALLPALLIGLYCTCTHLSGIIVV